jgi:hypothetical protein
MGVAPIPAMSASGSSARWALGLALSSIVLMLFGMFIFMVLFSEMVQERVGSKATQEDILRSAQDMMAKGEVPHSAKITVPVLTATLFSLFSLGLAIRSLTRGEHNRGTAIVACLLSILLLFCQLGTILNSVVKHVPSPVSVHEYSLHVRP